MHYYRVGSVSDPHLLVDTGDQIFDLTAGKPRITRFVDVARASHITDQTIDELTAALIEDSPTVSADLPAEAMLPVVPEEVWACGVTYQISEEAREAESGLPEVYLDVFESERPEVFMKGTASRTVGPGEAIGVRGDSDWNTPEPEFAIVLYDGEPVGYTIGNDVSSRSIEGANPLYLPQAKIYERSCSIGPCISTPDTIGDPHDIRMEMTIERDGEICYQDSTSTALMDRTCDELVSYWRRHNAIPEIAVLLTGTALVPEDDFSLSEGDNVSIEMESIGVLENPVIDV